MPSVTRHVACSLNERQRLGPRRFAVDIAERGSIEESRSAWRATASANHQGAVSAALDSSRLEVAPVSPPDGAEYPYTDRISAEKSNAADAGVGVGVPGLGPCLAWVDESGPFRLRDPDLTPLLAAEVRISPAPLCKGSSRVHRNR
jgi:hypothetical protein